MDCWVVVSSFHEFLLSFEFSFLKFFFCSWRSHKYSIFTNWWEQRSKIRGCLWSFFVIISLSSVSFNCVFNLFMSPSIFYFMSWVSRFDFYLDFVWTWRNLFINCDKLMFLFKRINRCWKSKISKFHLIFTCPVLYILFKQMMTWNLRAVHISLRLFIPSKLTIVREFWMFL